MNLGTSDHIFSIRLGARAVSIRLGSRKRTIKGNLLAVSDIRLRFSTTTGYFSQPQTNTWKVVLVELSMLLELRSSLQVALSKVVGMAADSENPITRVLFCGSQFPASQNYTRDYLQNHPYIQVDVVPLNDVPHVINDYHICVTKMMRMDSSVISRASQMKLMMQFGVGLEGVDIDAATKHGIKVARIPGDVTGNASSCAEMAVYLMLGLLKKQKEMEKALENRLLGEPIGDTLHGKTVFIMGYGNIGIELAKRLCPFGVKVIATKRKWVSDTQVSSLANGFSAQKGKTDDLIDKKGNHEDIFEFAKSADIVVCCLALNRETVGIVNQSFISSMKKGALLINVARGRLLDYEAVLQNLQSGHLGGLGTDVTWKEPFDPDDPILKLDNVIITPHVAGVTEYSYRSMAKVVGEVALQLHAGTPLRNLSGLDFVN